ncbi:hypothetical protein [Tunturiibacter gelidiferens]
MAGFGVALQGFAGLDLKMLTTQVPDTQLIWKSEEIRREESKLHMKKK